MTSKYDREQILAYLHEHRARLVQQYSLESFGVVGSIARSTYTPDSDVDLVVRFLPEARRIHTLKSELQCELEAAFGRPVQIVSEKYLKPYYRTAILKDAVYV